jgi:hypothetical protein
MQCESDPICEAPQPHAQPQRPTHTPTLTPTHTHVHAEPQQRPDLACLANGVDERRDEDGLDDHADAVRKQDVQNQAPGASADQLDGGDMLVNPKEGPEAHRSTSMSTKPGPAIITGGTG